MRRLVLTLAMGLAIAACAGSAADEPQTSTTAETTTTVATTTTTTAVTTTTVAAQSAPLFGGSDFYTPTDPLPPRNGDLIWIDPFETPPGTQGWKVLYRSEAIDGTPIAVSGYVMAPAGEPPADGYPVVSWAHGTTGMADSCAPTADPELGSFLSQVAPFLGSQYVFVATDYEGLGTAGVHPYVVGESQGRGVIDIVRAARQIPETNASDRFVVWGHSQGGHAALWAGEIAPAWAPELELVGVAAGAPPSQFSELNRALVESDFRGYLAMTVQAYSATYPEATPESVLTNEALARLDVLETGCLGEIQAAFGDVDPMLTVSELNGVEPWESLAAANEPGQSYIEAPVLILHGGEDEQIPVDTSATLVAEMCAAGSIVERKVYPGQSHAGVVLVYAIDLVNWIADRFVGLPPASDCTS